MPAPRLVCSDAERRYAVWAHDELRARGHEAWVETVWVRPQRAGGVALGCVLAAVGGLVALGAPVAGLAMAVVGAVSLVMDAAGRTGAARLLFPQRATQVVLVAAEHGGREQGALGWADARRGEAAPAGQVAVAAGGEAAPGRQRAAAGGEAIAGGGVCVEVLLVARTDVPRGGPARRFAGVPGGLCWLALAALAVVAAAAARVADVTGTALGAAQLVPTIVLLVAATVALDSYLAAPEEGSEEDAGVAAVLAAHDALVRDPPPGVAVGILLGPPDAVRLHVRREGLDPRRSALLVARPGPVRTRHHQWRAAAEAAGLAARGGGPRRLASAEAPPDAVEPLARALGDVLA